MDSSVNALLEEIELNLSLSESYTDDELIEELEAFLSDEESVSLAEKKKPGFFAKAKSALKGLFGKKKAKVASGNAAAKRKLAPDEKMVFGVVRKVGKGGKLLPKKAAAPKAQKAASTHSAKKEKVTHDGEDFEISTSTNKKTGEKETLIFNKAGKAVATGDEGLAKARARSKAGKSYWED